ncbi:MAG: hypothetical protein Q7S54_00400 [bacterium]|nr:hypothetical protein [bacterium]
MPVIITFVSALILALATAAAYQLSLWLDIPTMGEAESSIVLFTFAIFCRRYIIANLVGVAGLVLYAASWFFAEELGTGLDTAFFRVGILLWAVAFALTVSRWVLPLDPNAPCS